MNALKVTIRTAVCARSLRSRVAVGILLGVCASCSGAQTPPAPPAPSVPAAVTFAAGDITVHQVPAIATRITVYIGKTTSDNLAPPGSFECLLTLGSGSDRGCALQVMFDVGADYYVYLGAQPTMAGSPGLLGGEVWMRGQRVTRTTQISDNSFHTWTAGEFSVTDGSGSIR